MVIRKEMAAGAFKARCLQVMEEVRRGRGEVVITKRGVPVAKLVPVESTETNAFDCMRGTAQIVGDVIAPAVDPKEWEAFD